MSTTQQYATVRVPGHPRANNSGHVLEHIIVIERVLGRFLPERHPIHHVDENKRNNAPSNLVVCESDAYHQLLHRRQRALAACGDANAHRCKFCKAYDRQDDIVVDPPRCSGSGFSAYHRSCNRDVKREQQRKARESRRAA